MARHHRSLSTSELQASLQYAQTYLATDGAAEAFARRRALRVSVAEGAKERRKRLEGEMALLSQHSKGHHSTQIEQQLARLKAEWRKASADEKAASQALKSPSLDLQHRTSACSPLLSLSQSLSAQLATPSTSLGAPPLLHPLHPPTPLLLPSNLYRLLPLHHATLSRPAS
ncbi:hypothetical protein BCR35DRAFT_328835 [Leucosporidium creatinivorum]|uniref:Uncharacterized protein n=1 Tax=Leucosporidium creatinivorum TaxID=106004 RepID=A0A1Y2G0N6_9BASI|nr:hypothetical protein BCR35DRAFT_328835 [Leucosporidium creatinivorum]